MVLFVSEVGMIGVIVVVTVMVISPVVRGVVCEPAGDEDGSTGDTVLSGGITPESPVPLLLITLPLVAKVATPEVAETERRVDPFAEGAGGIMPEFPVDAKAIVLSLVAND